MSFTDTEARDARASALAARNLNGFDFVLVSLPPEARPPAAHLEVHFLNSARLSTLLASAALAKTLFPVRGGHRVRAGQAAGEVQVTGVFVQVAGRLPIARAGLGASERLAVETAGTTVEAELPAGATLDEVVATLNGTLRAGTRALALDRRLVIASDRTFDLTVNSNRRARGDGRSTGFETTPVSPPPDVLVMVVGPVGDYSTYTLATGAAVPGFDPVFDETGFKFRPGCFSTDCAPSWTPAPVPVSDPPIDYLAKDFDSFRHVVMSWMQARVPGWTPTSEADLSQVLLSAISAVADEISDYQDRVVNEAYVATARSRVSLARHARLMDYHVHQGNQASTWMAIELTAGAEVQPGGVGGDPAVIEVWAGHERLDDAAVVFRAGTPHLHHLLGAMGLYTWSGAVPGLAAGATAADLGMPSQSAAEQVRELIATGAVEQLLVQEHRDPLSGNPAGADPEKRQLLRLEPDAAEARRDPLTGDWHVSVAWREEDRLRQDYCFAVETQGGFFDDVSRFHGNLVEVRQGRLREFTFRPPGARIVPPDEHHLEETTAGADGRPRWGTLARLPADAPLLYGDTAPGSEVAPASTLEVAEVGGERWSEVISLVFSDPADRHFAVETDELGRSVIRFGNGLHGQNLHPDASVRCSYQSGSGPDGNVGRDRIRRFDRVLNPKVVSVWNPFDVTSGRAPEPREQILRNVPEVYRARQLRAVTLGDYVRRAEEVPGVARAAAAYAWTGSWRTVRVTVDPLGTDVLRPELRTAVARHLEPVRLIGEDLEIRPPVLVPLRMRLSVCVDPEVWLADLRAVLEQEFSDGYTPDGRLGFFHPDRWTFGQTLHASQVLGRVEEVPGIAFASSVLLARWDAPTPGVRDRVEVGSNEIVSVHNDPDHMERGSIVFDLAGGRG